MAKQIVPAILTDDIKDLKAKLTSVAKLTDWVQVDIMDGNFVNNTSVSLTDLAKLPHSSNISAHLMVLNPEKYLADCKAAGVKRVLVHFKSSKDIGVVLKKAKKMGFQVGLAISPKVFIEQIKKYIALADIILVLGVEPGFGGQKLIPESLNKIKELKRISPKKLIEIDGGVTLENISEISEAGADIFVIGSGIFKTDNIKKTIKQLKRKVNPNLLNLWGIFTIKK
ncbi:MAG: hypothetical protein CMI53_02335 [Parcubacteria group bacterium]|nr:hypothetical protein [Parcubacteria group bacterium]|tara:strand:- start:7801 stop:8478 length:678 start_codon:yes stop_codon:yes gene_type:complete